MLLCKKNKIVPYTTKITARAESELKIVEYSMTHRFPAFLADHPLLLHVTLVAQDHLLHILIGMLQIILNKTFISV